MKELKIKKDQWETRTDEQLYEHYLIEKELAARLNNSSKNQRLILYTKVYNELFNRVPLHPQITRKKSPEVSAESVYQKILFVKKFLQKNFSFMEVGAGDCSFALNVAKYVREVYAIDVSNEISANSAVPENFKLIISNGIDIPVPEISIDIAFSDQLMEHLHPEDAIEQLKNIFEALKFGGIYICVTPDKINGPHDISKYYDDVATGFHLKEYSVSELSKIFKSAGFKEIKLFFKFKKSYFRLPISIAIMLETIITKFSQDARRKIVSLYPFRAFFEFRLVGVK